MIDFAVEDHAESANRVSNRHIAPGLTGELLGNVHRLAEEVLHLARARHQDLVIVRQLFYAENRNDILQILVTLQHLLRFARCGIVLLAHHLRRQDVAGTGQRVNRREQATRQRSDVRGRWYYRDA